MNISFGTVLGLDIGVETVKIAELRFAFKSFELVGYQESSYLTSGEGVPLVSETLKTLLPEKKLSRKKIMVSLPGSRVAFRIITFPFAEKKKIDSVINFEVENLLPFNSEEIIVDYAVLGRNGAGVSVLCAVAEKEETGVFLDDLKRAGIDPEAVDVDLFAFFNTVHANFFEKKSAYMAINIDSRSTSVLILDNGRLRCVKTVNLGHNDLVPREEKSGRSDVLVEPGSSPASYLATDKTREFLSDLKRVTRFATGLGFGKIGEVVWCGRKIEGLTETLSKEFDVTVTHWNPMNMKGIKKGGFQIMGDENSSAVALGLSLRDTSRKFSGVDFRKSIFPVKSFFQGFSGNIKTPLVLSGIALTLLTLSLYLKQMTFQDQFRSLKAEGKKIFRQALPDVRRVVNEVLQLDEKIDGLDHDLRILGTVEGSTGSPIDFLREISLHFPAGDTGEIYRYTFGKEDIRIEGLAVSLKAVDSIKKELSLIDGFSGIQVVGTKLAADKKSVDFKIIMTFDAARG